MTIVRSEIIPCLADLYAFLAEVNGKIVPGLN
jgi:hypothetical protein